jgi:hypothetical protein
MSKFLTKDWFEKVQEITNEWVGKVEIHKGLADVIVNLTILTEENHEIQMCMNRGLIQLGFVEKPDVEMTMPENYARDILIKGDWSVGMKGYIKREIKVSGNMRKLIPIQKYQPTDSQEQLRQEIEQITT